MANTVTVENLVDRVQLAVNDTGASPHWITPALYDTFWINKIVQTEAVHQFQLYGTGLWRLTGDIWGGNPYCLQFASATAPITGAASTGTYNISTWGTMRLTGDTDTTAIYSVTGCIVDYAAIMSELFFWLAQHRALQMANSAGQDVGSTARYLIDASNRWAGISAGGCYFGGTQ